MTLKASRAAEYLASFLLGDATRQKKTLSRRVGDAVVCSFGCFEAARSRELAPSQADWLELASFLAAASRRLPGHDLASTRLLLVRSIRSCARELSRPRFPRIPELPFEFPVGRSRAAKALRSGASSREIFASCVSCFHRSARALRGVLDRGRKAPAIIREFREFVWPSVRELARTGGMSKWELAGARSA